MPMYKHPNAEAGRKPDATENLRKAQFIFLSVSASPAYKHQSIS